ncbi:hypothetical protein HNR42_002385 [Deinobacterium chartae]|uniref:Uncharacterized protein n=1 Tax=Deinobacterium chartae TaxID=521158 RepID=A0A841I3F2_9DEIO|nr:hypothetical protein [Deinobacterium chartae]
MPRSFFVLWQRPKQRWPRARFFRFLKAARAQSGLIPYAGADEIGYTGAITISSFQEAPCVLR